MIEIGRFSYAAGLHCGFLGYTSRLSRIKIGCFTAIAENVSFFLKTNHHPEWHTIYPFEWMPWPEGLARPVSPHDFQPDNITVGSDVWVGHNSRILPGRVIGDGAVIAAGTVVTRDVRPYAIYAGNPGLEVKRRFEDSIVDFLLDAKWWDLPTETIRRLSPALCASDTDALKTALMAVL